MKFEGFLPKEISLVEKRSCSNESDIDIMSNDSSDLDDSGEDYEKKRRNTEDNKSTFCQ